MRALFLLWWLLWASMAQAQPTTVDLETISPAPTGEWDFEGGKFHLPETTVASLPAAGTSGRIYIVTDTHGTLCASSGGGTTRLICRDTGAAWEAIGSGGGGGGTECASAPCNLNASTTLNSKNICLADGTNCPGITTPTPTLSATPTVTVTATRTATPTPTTTATLTPILCPTNGNAGGLYGAHPEVCQVTPTPTTTPTPTLSATPTVSATATPCAGDQWSRGDGSCEQFDLGPDSAGSFAGSSTEGGPATSAVALTDGDKGDFTCTSGSCVLDQTYLTTETDPGVPLLALSDLGDLCAGNQTTERNSGDTANVCFDPEEEGEIGGVTVSGTSADDKLLIGDSGSGATWRAIADCTAAGGVLQYDTTANASGLVCHTLVSTDLPNLDAAKITSGTLPLARGGTNNASLTNCSTGQVATVTGGKVDCIVVPQADIAAALSFVVDLAGNDSTGTGSVNKPVKTINKALDLIAAQGDACAATCAADASAACSACFGGTNAYTCSVVGDCSAGATSCTSGRCVYPCNEDSDCAGGGSCKGSRCSSNTARTCSVAGDCPGGDTCSVANNNSMCGGAACSSTPKTYGVLMNPGYWNEQVTVARSNLPGCVALIGNGKLTNQILSSSSCTLDYSNTNRFAMAFATAVNTGDGDAICSSGNGNNPTFTGVGAVHDGKGRDVHITGRGNITTNILDITTFGRGAKASGYSVDIENWGSSCSHDRTIGCVNDAGCNALSGGSVCDGKASADVDLRGGLIQAGVAAYCVGGTQDGTDCTASATACTNGGGTCDGGAAVRIAAKACGNGFNNLLVNPLIKANGVGAGTSTGLKITQVDCGAGSPFTDQLKVLVNNGTVQGTDVIGGTFDPDVSVDVGAGTTLWNQGLSYDVSQRSIAGSLVYGDSTNFTGGNTWLGWLRTDPPDPQNGECWYAVDLTQFRCRENGGTIPMRPNLFGTVHPSAGSDVVSDAVGDTFNVTGTAPVVVTGDASTDTLTITCNVASGSQPGCLASADFTLLSNETRTHATDCTSLTDGKAGQLCVDLDDFKTWTCVPSAGDCDTAGEWKREGGPTPLLDGATHSDTTAGTVARGDLITGQTATPKWQRLAKGTANQVLTMDSTATDVTWANPLVRTHATDCTSLTDGKAGSLCEDQDDGKLWVCLPSSGDCDTVGEWKQIERVANKNAASGYLGLDASSKLDSYSYISELLPLGALSDVAIASPALNQVVQYNGSSWVNAAIAAAPSVKVRTSNSDAKNNNNTLWDDQGTGPDLTGFAVVSGTTYRVEGDILVTTGTTADIQFAFKGPSSSTCRISAVSFNTPTTSAEPPAFYTDCDNAPTGVKVADMAGSSLNHVRVSGYFTAGGNGTFDFQWSQNNAQSTNTTVDAGSALSVAAVQ